MPRQTYVKYLQFSRNRSHDGSILERILQGPLEFIPRNEAEAEPDFKQLVTDVILRSDTHILTFRRGQTPLVPKLIQKRLCFGFGGHVNESDFRAAGSARDKVRCSAMQFSEEISFTPSLLSEIRSNLRFVGILNDDLSTLGERHFAAVLLADLTADARVIKLTSQEAEELDLAWKSLHEIENCTAELELWSNMCLAAGLTKSVIPSS